MKVIRILEYEGPSEWVEATLANSIGHFELPDSSTIKELGCIDCTETPTFMGVGERQNELWWKKEDE